MIPGGDCARRFTVVLKLPASIICISPKSVYFIPVRSAEVKVGLWSTHGVVYPRRRRRHLIFAHFNK